MTPFPIIENLSYYEEYSPLSYIAFIFGGTED